MIELYQKAQIMETHEENRKNQLKNAMETARDHDQSGVRELIDKYNINDQAYSDSSPDDFVKTVSGYNHANDIAPETDGDEIPGGTSSN